MDKWSQCTCSAFFTTTHGLDLHVEEYRARESYLSAQLELCRTHSKANDGDNPDSDSSSDFHEDVNENVNSSAIRNSNKAFRCPSEECDRNKPFKDRKNLRRHFRQHVECREVCVCCHRVSKRVSEYIRHAECHRDVGQPKAGYIQQMCDELRRRATDELGLAESRVSRIERGNKKRAHEEYIDSRTLGTQKARLHAVDINELGSRLPNDTQANLPSTQSATVFQPLLGVTEPVTTSFLNISTEPFYPDSITALDNINFDAPINGIINFPELWMGTGSGIQKAQYDRQ